MVNLVGQSSIWYIAKDGLEKGIIVFRRFTELKSNRQKGK